MPPILRVHELTKTYGPIVAVDGVSFAVERGEIFAFLGPNGAGKSTTIKMLTALVAPTSGSIEVAGYDPARDPDRVRRAFGIVFQEPSLDGELTAFENMELHAVLYHVPRAERRRRIDDLLVAVDLWDRRDSIVKKFSGGMKRRLEVARGLLHHPRILFLDEPTIGLDPQTRNLVWRHVAELNAREQTTVFFTTHYMDEAERIAQRVAIIDRGRIVAQGSPADLKGRTGTASLEAAFLVLTGRPTREDAAVAVAPVDDGERPLARAAGGR